ncbi:MAG: hypothetical protein M3Y72_02980 [Acidobacteriota bacterium]|nr:hypothetical protein [Acidobacteriota bacterium]
MGSSREKWPLPNRVKPAVDAVVLAGTDVSYAFDEASTNFVRVECVRAHIRGIMRETALYDDFKEPSH